MGKDMMYKRLRTRNSWEAMIRRFDTEWEDAHSTYLFHQKTHPYWWIGHAQVVRFFAAHRRRMIDERWPDIKSEGER